MPLHKITQLLNLEFIHPRRFNLDVSNFTLYPPIIHAPQMTDAEEEVRLSHATI